jgi:NhaP-type Na+/H+ or K+/H+ antiporter
MFEQRHEPLLSRAAFLRRMVKYALLASGFIAVSLVIGMAGYHYFEGMSWIDAFVNAAMLMGGMGPVSDLHTDAGKLFAGIYALYCGLIVIIAIGIVAAPLLHRILHHFHLEVATDKAEEESDS